MTGDPRQSPHAAREMASMFDQVSPRYDLLNRIMTLGRDRAWRRRMWQAVPENARVVLDLCTGNGVSLPGLRRPGRLVLGVDVSLAMLADAAATMDASGWAPRLLAADAFCLPLRNDSVDCVTIAFGIRNLRPRNEALAELARVIKPGGTLVVLEAAAPKNGPLSAFHAFYLRRFIPFAGRLSPDPSAYAYLSRSILEFGTPADFEADLERGGFEPVARRSFMLGATHLWSARRSLSEGARPMQPARVGKLARGEMPTRNRAAGAEWRWWNGAQLVLSTALVIALGFALWKFTSARLDLHLEAWQRQMMRVLLAIGLVGFTARTVQLWLRLMGPPPPR